MQYSRSETRNVPTKEPVSQRNHARIYMRTYLGERELHARVSVLHASLLKGLGNDTWATEICLWQGQQMSIRNVMQMDLRRLWS